MNNQLDSVGILMCRKPNTQMYAVSGLSTLFLAMTLAFQSHALAASGTYNNDTTGGAAVINRVLDPSGFGNSLNVGSDLTGNQLSINNSNLSIHNVFAGWSSNNTPTNHTLTITGSNNVGGGVFGGASRNNGATGNTVTFTNSTSTSTLFGILGGYSMGSGNILNNTVTFTNSNAVLVYGGYSSIGGDVSDNTVTMEGSSSNISSIVAGGYSQSGNVSNNFLDLKDGTTVQAFGAHSESGDATGNKLNMSGGTTTNSVAGYSDSGDANNNISTMTGGTVTGVLAGGYSLHGNASDNSLTMSNNSNSMGTQMTAAGGYTSGSGNVTGNSLTIGKGFVKDGFGGYSDDGDATNNVATMTGGTVENVFVGGFANGAGTASGNQVFVTGGSFIDITTDDQGVIGGFSRSGLATNNTVTITNGTFLDFVTGGHAEQGSATNNVVKINGGEFKRLVTGGYAEQGSATNNSITISDGTFEATSRVAAGRAPNSVASGNDLTITGGQFLGHVTGGRSDNNNAIDNSITISGGTFEASSIITGGRAPNGAVTGNTVHISGGTFKGIIAGGFTGNANDIINNTVIIDNNGLNTLDLEMATIAGGVDGMGQATTNLRSSNRLVVTKPITINKLRNFEHYEFHLDAVRSPMITSNSVENDAIHIGTDARISLFLADNTALKHGDTIELFATPAPATIGGNIHEDIAVASQGFHIQYELKADPSLGIRNLEVVRTGAHPHSRTFAEGRLASFAFMNQGTDLVAGQGIASAVSASLTMDKRTNAQSAGEIDSQSWTGFSAISGGTSKYETANGSDADVNFDGISFLIGLSKGSIPFLNNELILGFFFEAGHGSIDAHNSFSNANDITTDGNVTYYGGGALARFDHKSGVYAEGFLRAGLLDSDYTTKDIRFTVNHDEEATYYSAGIGVGYQFIIKEQHLLDVYTRYAWTYLQEEDQIIDNVNYAFNSIESHQVRIGTRYTKKPDANISPYFGVAWEHEFEGDAEATVQNFDLSTPSITGSSGIFEIGTNILLSDTIPLTLDFAIEAYIGKREGVAGHGKIMYAF